MSEIKASFESRFGDPGKLDKILREGQIVSLGPIENFCSVPPHENVVELVDIPINKGVNRSLGVEIQSEKGIIRAVFKPTDGEAKRIRLSLGIESLAHREVAACAIDRHFGFDLVPPTVYRKGIDDKEGSLQLFLDHQYFRHPTDLTDEEWSRTMSGEDWQKMAAFDAITMNTDRKPENMLVRYSDPCQIAAIDHGFILSQAMLAKDEIKGPILVLTFDNRKEKPIDDSKIAPVVLKKLESGLERFNALERELVKTLGVPKGEVAEMKRWLEALVKKGRFLSAKNHAVSSGRF